MKRASPQNSITAKSTAAKLTPSADNTALALREAKVLMAPVATWLLRHGAAYPAFAEAMKAVFLDAARGELEGAQAATNASITQSALSMLSGVHRKDVRALSELKAPAAATASVSLPSQVFTRWLTEKRYRDADGTPRALMRTAPAQAAKSSRKLSFEGLCRELSNDVHPRAVLDELLRLGQVVLDGDKVTVAAQAFIPAGKLDEMNALFAANAADHVAAAVSNITGDAPKFLEQSIFADGLTAESVDVLHAAARQAWAHAFSDVVAQARARVELDAALDDQGLAPMRMRFGVYFYNEAVGNFAAVAVKKAPRALPKSAAKKIKLAPAVEVTSARQKTSSTRTRSKP
jgi:Family of unknown function (DUF6502)